MNKNIEQMRLEIKSVINLTALEAKERMIVEYRFGLTDNTTRTLEQVGKIFNLTRERIRQIEAKAICKMRAYAEANNKEFNI